MKVEKELRDIMGIIGLSNYDVKAYVTLVENGPLTARDVALRSGIPTSKVYSVLHRLYRLGFVQIDDKRRPELFYAVSPNDAFSKVMQRFNDYVNSIRPLIDSLQLMYESAYRGKVTAQSEVLYVVRGLESTKELMVKSMGYGNIDLATPYAELLDYRVLSILEEVSRNNEVRLLITQDLMPNISNLPPRIHVRIKDELFGGGLIGVDGVVLVIRQSNNYISLYSRQDYIIDIAKTYFNYLWTNSAQLQR
ncbi:MAG: TrmB family transcriptional regulator [Vulcanisaeta sp. AZ3]|jgi:sugar-specific transcriptional regulator TrmB|nr:MAG: TrmB family transcriptional regulator [Vulcanisaeta sp. AZ3]